MVSTQEFRFRIEPLGKHHNREQFTCGNSRLDSYLRTQASQDMRRKANAVFVLVPAETPGEIAGYFTLCAYGISPGTVLESARKYILRYPLVSATLIGRLAIAKKHQGMGLGSDLLARALQKALENASVVGSSMVVVDAIDEKAVRFYQAHGFLKLPESMRLILPLQVIARINLSSGLLPEIASLSSSNYEKLQTRSSPASC
jgi:GNAT superfamily N-acetyltransferase